MTVFEDILDGYFPLRISITDLMRRRGLHRAALTFSFAPILEVAGLPHSAPVPLSIRSGRAGMINWAKLEVSMLSCSTKVVGRAQWHWLDGTPSGDKFDPMTRLAEPALVSIWPKFDAPVLNGEITFSAT